eukprot:TRINITY_DN1287_c0_g1_i4.p1 TRINITY_DN1287_c0_g1~~TRINITY_DN1287_c0_g1_i4.p1  ORF type:complete len:101 (+),score=0.22 TRINITY_DN1287_c0_g1_i4:1171-1473(+)
MENAFRPDRAIPVRWMMNTIHKYTRDYSLNNSGEQHALRGVYGQKSRTNCTPTVIPSRERELLCPPLCKHCKSLQPAIHPSSKRAMQPSTHGRTLRSAPS